jgi:enamine deaminase RidA (YjgF/YER057c/UK114 family)
MDLSNARTFDHEPLLLVGGTASIRGEQSQHDGNLAAQTEETLANLEALVQSAMLTLNPSTEEPLRREGVLHQFLHVRVYWVRPDDRFRIQNLIGRRFGELRSIEWVKSALCRPELLVEIEGVATLRHCARRHHLVLVSDHA